MNIQSFLQSHGLAENPFDAEEARHDPVFERLIDAGAGHPDFGKILGRLDQPSTAVVFGEKGTGKTALKLMIAHRVRAWNQARPTRRTLVLRYDDLNPVLDRLAQRRFGDGLGRAGKVKPEKVLESLRLEDHQDAILSLAVTRMLDIYFQANAGNPDDEGVPVPTQEEITRRLSHEQRIDLAVLAALYDQPRGGGLSHRWSDLVRRLRLVRLPVAALLKHTAAVLAAGALALFVAGHFSEGRRTLFLVLSGLAAVGALASGMVWAARHLRAWSLSRRITGQTPAVERRADELKRMLLALPPKEVGAQPWPAPNEHDSRYRLTAKLMGLLPAFGCEHLLVLVDRVDEPTMVHGRADRMKSVIWPMFDNKFLQQEGIGLKLLLPIELRHLLHREGPEFFQEARLDKQNMVDRLSWSGATLYDLCNARMRACMGSGKAPVAAAEGRRDGGGAARTDGAAAGTLPDLFEPDVGRDMLIDALEQMNQPRDAFKFLYSVIQEHCNTVPDDAARLRIPRLTLESIRRRQAQRVQDLARGVTPA